MPKFLTTLALICVSFQAFDGLAENSQPFQPSSAAANPVIEWNRTLLVIVRTSGAQPATIHSTRNFAILHAAIYDAVNNIDGTFTPYLVRLVDVSPRASQPA